MARSLLTLLLLVHYLLVVSVSVSVRAARPVTRPFAYVHGHDCQLKNAWRGGTCFEDCNGVQYQVHKGHKFIPLQQLLTSLKGMVCTACPLPLPWLVALLLARPAAYCRAGKQAYSRE